MEPIMPDQKKVLLYSNSKNFLLAAGVLIAVFVTGYLVGYLPSRTSASKVTEQNSQLQQNLALTEKRLRLAELRGQMGIMSYEANRNNYAEASKFSTEFFNGLRETLNDTNDEALKQKLSAIVARRDEITTNMAQADSSVKEKLAQMFADLFKMTAR
ncbi:MAG: hypothetical protein Q8S00_23745 [Deltaproteobacteria bacterium]|nr:hypothetical protein [Deltaproteobacteria bacterium]